MNFVVIMTDTQNRDMVGAYGVNRVDTPNLDRLASEGICFDRAYTTCPLCTPARSGIFSGTHPTVNGAWCNNAPPYSTYPLMGTIFKHHGYRTAYTGKWHLDGSGYFGDGEPGGGFEAEWWYDGKRYAEDIGPEKFKEYLDGADFDLENIWGHRVADRAIDFLNQVGRDPFVLVVSFDEPHGPCVAPPEYHESFDTDGIAMRANFGAPLDGKPHLQQLQRGKIVPGDWAAVQKRLQRHYACNAYIDREIGRVINTVDSLDGDDTTIIYTSDHGGMQGSHSLFSKGPMMYEEVTNIPFVIRTPGTGQGTVSQSVVSHLDIIPTMLELAGHACPPSLQGVSLCPVIEDPSAEVRDFAMLSFTRFAVNHDDWGEFYPIRCVTDGRHKLAINLHDSDEFYDLQTDPFEMTNAIADPQYTEVRDKLHDWLLVEMDRIRDPFRSYLWGDREWRSVRQQFYKGGKRRNRLAGFPFQPAGIEADGSTPR